MRSTALGTIGVIITVLAGILLVVAVAIRQVRRLRNRTPREPAGADTGRGHHRVPT